MQEGTKQKTNPQEEDVIINQLKVKIAGLKVTIQAPNSPQKLPNLHFYQKTKITIFRQSSKKSDF